MPDNRSELIFSITDTIKDIPQDCWDNLFGPDIIEGLGYHKNLEDAGIANFYFRYLLAKRNDKLLAVIPFFFTVFSFTTIIRGPIQKFIFAFQKIFPRFLKIKIIFVGMPTTEQLYIGISKEENFNEILGGVLKKLHIFAKSELARAIVFFNLKKEQQLLARYLGKKGFSVMENYPNTSLEINASSFEDYTKQLSRNTRKDLKRKLRKSAELAALKSEVLENIDSVKDQIYKLYLNNFAASDIHFEILTPAYFQNIGRNMPGIAKFFVTWKEDKIVAFNLCLVKGKTFIDKFIGFEQNTARQYHLYQVTFRNNLDWCIKNGIRFYGMGITDYHPKLRLGAKLIPLYVYAKFLNPLINLAMRFVAPWLAPKNFDPTLKKLKQSFH